MALPVTDSFTGDANPIGGIWTTLDGHSAILKASGTATGSINGDCACLCNSESPDADHYAKITITQKGIASGVMVRMSNADNGYGYLFMHLGGSQSLYKLVNGNWTSLRNGTGVNNGDILELDVEGESLVQKLNGSTQATTNDSSISAAGSFGFRVSSNSDLLDDFEGGNVAAGGSGSISAAGTGTSTASGTLKGIGKLAGASQGIASTAASLKGIGELAGTSNGLAVSSGQVKGIGKLSGAITSESSVAGIVKGIGRLQGTAEGTSTATGEISYSSVSGAILGGAYGTCVVSGTLKGIGKLSGIVEGTSSASGTLSQLLAGEIYAAIQGTSVVSGTLKGLGRLNGVSSGKATVRGTLYPESAWIVTAAKYWHDAIKGMDFGVQYSNKRNRVRIGRLN